MMVSSSTSCSFGTLISPIFLPPWEMVYVDPEESVEESIDNSLSVFTSFDFLSIFCLAKLSVTTSKSKNGHFLANRNEQML